VGNFSSFPPPRSNIFSLLEDLRYRPLTAARRLGQDCFCSFLFLLFALYNFHRIGQLESWLYYPLSKSVARFLLENLRNWLAEKEGRCLDPPYSDQYGWLT
jgi:hypothetical protein